MRQAPTDQLAQITNRLKTSSATVPALILAAICCSVALPGLLFGSERLTQIFVVILCVGLILPALQIAFFTFFDRDRLQNEDHVERKMLMARLHPEIGDRQHAVVLEANSASLVPNPSAGENGDA